MEHTFKVLTYKGEFVDEGKLMDGIYAATKPTLHLDDVSIPHLVRRAENSFKHLPVTEESKQRYFDNLKECQMDYVKLTFAQ